LSLRKLTSYFIAAALVAIVQFANFFDADSPFTPSLVIELRMLYPGALNLESDMWKQKGPCLEIAVLGLSSSLIALIRNGWIIVIQRS